MVNDFCEIDYFKESFPKWDGVDAFLWKVFDDDEIDDNLETGPSRLWAYKYSYIYYNRASIKHYAQKENIPALLLAGVAIAEVGGMPERFKAYGVLQAYQMIDLVKRTGNSKSNATSVGSLAIQLGVAAKTLGFDPKSLTTSQQLQLSNCLLDDDFNISVVAKHLKDLIIYDNPDIKNTLNITPQQMIIAASRYNRGTARKKKDFVDSINAPPGSAMREYSSYGRSIIDKADTIQQILDMN